MFFRSRKYLTPGGQVESRQSTDESVNQPSRLETIWEGSHVSDTSSDTDMSTHTYDSIGNVSNRAGTSMKFAMFLDFLKLNQHGAQIYEDPMMRFAVKVEDRPSEFQKRPSVNYQEDRYVDTEGSLYLVVKDYKNVDKWGQVIDAKGKSLELPEAPPKISRLAEFRVVNS